MVSGGIMPDVFVPADTSIIPIITEALSEDGTLIHFHLSTPYKNRKKNCFRLFKLLMISGAGSASDRRR
jgi:hypothetical protein